MTARKRYQTKQAVSAGGVVYRHGAAGLDVVLVKTPRGMWGLPKGTPNPAETLEQAALREVQEETGLEVALGEKVGSIEYWFAEPRERVRYHKYVHFWLMQPQGGSLDQHDAEHDCVEWHSFPKALRRVTHANTVRTLERAATLLNHESEGAASWDARPDGATG